MTTLFLIVFIGAFFLLAFLYLLSIPFRIVGFLLKFVFQFAIALIGIVLALSFIGFLNVVSP